MECISLCAWHFLFVYLVSQCIHALNCLYQLDFFLEIFLWRLYTLVLYYLQSLNLAFSFHNGFSTFKQFS